MSQESNQVVKTFVASESISAYAVVGILAGSYIAWDTLSANIVGVAMDNASTNGALPVCIAGTAKVRCFASVPTSVVVGPASAGSGSIQNRGATGTSTANFEKVLGVSLENGSTNAVIEVLLQVQNGGLLH